MTLLDCDFELEPKDHPQREEMESDLKAFLQSNDIPLTKKLERQIELTACVSMYFADSPFSERLLATNRLFFIWFIADDIRDEEKVTINGKLWHDEFLALHQDETRPQTDPWLKALKSVLTFIKKTSDPEWHKTWLQAWFQCGVYCEELAYGPKGEKSNYSEAMVGRFFDVFAVPALLVQEYIDEKYVPNRLRNNQVYFLLLYHASWAMTLYNDLISIKKEDGHANPCSGLNVLMLEKGFTTEKAVQFLQEQMIDHFGRFKALLKRVNKLFIGEDLIAMTHTAKRLHRSIQGNKDYSFAAQNRYNLQ